MKFNDLHAELRHPLVRALAWALGSPSVFNPAFPSWGGQLFDDAAAAQWLETAAPWLRELDKNPAPLARWMGDAAEANVRRPLGKTFEQLIGFWLEHRADVAWVAPSVLVKHSGRVVGEFDHVFADVSGQVHTLELTVKFYLRIAPDKGAHGYVGPMVYDFMAEKIARMTSHQMPLGRTDDGQRALRALLVRKGHSIADDAPVLLRTQALARGILFSQFGVDDVAAPNEVSPAFLRGHWVRTLEAETVPSAQLPVWKALNGIEWLGPQRAQPTALTTLAACISAIGKERHVMVGQFAPHPAESGEHEEVQRWMILKPDARVFNVAQNV